MYKVGCMKYIDLL